MELEDKFLVLKRSDVEEALNELEKKMLRRLAARVQGYRMEQGKLNQNRYVVINQDEPYFPDVLKLMEHAECAMRIRPTGEGMRIKVEGSRKEQP